MKQLKAPLIAVVVLLIVGSGLYLLNKYRTRTFTQGIYVGKCDVQECHGVNLTCGRNVPDACTEMYQVGDGCRNFFACTVRKGSCVAAENPRFDICKSCITECEKKHGQDAEAVFQCDSQCIQMAQTAKIPSPTAEKN